MTYLEKFFALFVMFGFIETRALATPEDHFATDINQLRIFAQENPLDLSEFLHIWGNDLKMLHAESFSDRHKESQLEHRMNSLTKLLSVNFNRQGIELVSKYAPVNCQLALARAYFREDDQFNLHNRPPQENAALLASSALYESMMKRIQALIQSCCQELDFIADTGGCINDIRFQCLPPSLREERVGEIRKAISIFTGYEAQNPMIGGFKLSSLRTSSAQIIREDLTYALDLFLKEDKKNLAWCTYYVLGQKKLSQDLYAYERAKLALEENTTLPRFIEWFRNARSLNAMKDVRT